MASNAGSKAYETMMEEQVIRWLAATGTTLLLALDCLAAPQAEVEAAKGKALLETNCAQCHAVAADKQSPLKQAPNLWVVLGSWPSERLDIEMADGVAPRHPDMPRVEFSAEEIDNIYAYLHGHWPEVPPGRQ